MRIGVLGTGVVGQAIGSALVKKGFSVMMGSRTGNNEKAKAWMQNAGEGALEGSFDEAVLHGDLIFICLNGAYTLEALRTITPKHALNKIFVDLTNPLDFTKGMPPKLLDEFRDISLGEHIQKTLSGAHVIKAMNTINYNLMVDARKVNNAQHNIFLCGDNIDAKNKVKHFLVDNFHWKPDFLIDLGDIKAARATEAIVPFWVMVWQNLGTPLFNFQVVH